MKYRYLLAVFAIITLLSISVYAIGYQYTISTSNDFTSAKYGDNLDEVATKLNMTPQDINSYFSKNGLLYLAVSSDNKTQVKVSAFNDNFSSEISDISYLDDVGLSKFMSALSEDSDTDAEVIENNGRKYICVKDTLNDSGGVYTVTQYITICNNQTFYFAGYNPGEDTSEVITEIFKSFNLQEDTTPSQESLKVRATINRQYIFINCGIVVFGVVSIIAIIGIIKTNLKSNKEQPDDED